MCADEKLKAKCFASIRSSFHLNGSRCKQRTRRIKTKGDRTATDIAFWILSLSFRAIYWNKREMEKIICIYSRPYLIISVCTGKRKEQWTMVSFHFIEFSFRKWKDVNVSIYLIKTAPHSANGSLELRTKANRICFWH